MENFQQLDKTFLLDNADRLKYSVEKMLLNLETVIAIQDHDMLSFFSKKTRNLKDIRCETHKFIEALIHYKCIIKQLN